jgi:hypothetical protein
MLAQIGEHRLKPRLDAVDVPRGDDHAAVVRRPIALLDVMPALEAAIQSIATEVATWLWMAGLNAAMT